MNSRKSEILLNEAKIDIQAGSLNKAVSPVLLGKKRVRIYSGGDEFRGTPSRRQAGKCVEAHGFQLGGRRFTTPLHAQEKADYDERSVTEEESREALVIATRLLDALRKVKP